MSYEKIDSCLHYFESRDKKVYIDEWGLQWQNATDYWEDRFGEIYHGHASNETMKCKMIEDPLWRFNLAFLLAYEGDLKGAIRQYWPIVNYTISPIALSQIEDFLCWVLVVELEKNHFYYFLGYDFLVKLCFQDIYTL